MEELLFAAKYQRKGRQVPETQRRQEKKKLINLMAISFFFWQRN